MQPQKLETKQFNFYTSYDKGRYRKRDCEEKVQIQTIVEAFMDEVKGSLENGEAVYLRGFGSFIIKERAEKVARNISKNTTITIPAHNIPAFKPAKSFASKIK